MEEWSNESLLWGRLVTRGELEKSAGDQTDYLLNHKDLVKISCIKDGVCQRCSSYGPENIQEIPGLDGLEGSVYCTNCIQLANMNSRSELYHLPAPDYLEIDKETARMTWEGTLSAQQQVAADSLINSLSDSMRPHLVHAVTGAGKTEMIFPVIEKVLMQGGRVGVASPRIDVCLELAPRLQEAFQGIEVGLLYGGAEEAYSYKRLTVLTTHQLLRFSEAFDLLIIDEVDAFPYAGDEGLHYAVQRAVRKPTGKLVYLTATPDQELRSLVQKDELEVTTLPARYHGHPLPEPDFVWLGDWKATIKKRDQSKPLLKYMRSFVGLEGAKLVFMPNIYLAEKLFNWLKEEFPNVKMSSVHASDPERKSKVQALRDEKIDLLVTTTILERGVTFTNCQVFIVGAESDIYSVAALVQMSGRVGRRPNFPTGQLYWGHYGISRSMLEARRQIHSSNNEAKERGLLKEVMR